VFCIFIVFYLLLLFSFLATTNKHLPLLLLLPWLHQVGDGSTASIRQNGTLQSDVQVIPDERDRRYGPPPPPKRSDDDAAVSILSKLTV